MDPRDLARRAVEICIELGAEFADARLLSHSGLRVEVADGRVREVKSVDEVGLALRCFVGGGWGFTSTSILMLDEVERACREAFKLAKAAGQRVEEKASLKCECRGFSIHVKPRVDPLNLSVEEKVEMCLGMEREMRELDSRVRSTSSVYLEAREELFVVNSLGLESTAIMPTLLVVASAYASEAGVTQRGYESNGGVGGLEVLEPKGPKAVARDAAQEALELLKAKSPPAGKFTCILDPELAGVFIHEAFGHACEADIVLSGGSILEGMIGKSVGSREVVVKDDPTLKGLFGYTPVDSEGVEGRGTTIVEMGTLKSYLHSLETSSRMSAKPTGNGRAQGYMNAPIVRMTNTFIDRGSWKVEELFEGVERGVYAKGSSYGYVDTAKGEFVFKCSRLYIIERGELKQLCRDAALSGFTLEVLRNVDAVAGDLSFKPGLCGKEGQWVRVSTGSPHIRVRDVVIGGML